MIDIVRHRTGSRMSQIVVHNATAYFAGQIPDTPEASIEAQTREVLSKIERLLDEAGTDQSRLIAAQIWLRSMHDFAAFNRIWEEWIESESAPVRACVQAELANPNWKVEVQVTAGLHP